MTDDTLTALEAAQAEIARLERSCAALEASNAILRDALARRDEHIAEMAAKYARQSEALTAAAMRRTDVPSEPIPSQENPCPLTT